MKAMRHSESKQVRLLLAELKRLRRTEEALRESEERYRNLVQQSSEAIVLIDPASRTVIESNRRFQELLGYLQTELENLPVYHFVLGSKEQIDLYFDEILPISHQLPLESRRFRHKRRTTRCTVASCIAVRVLAARLSGRQWLCWKRATILPKGMRTDCRKC